MENSACFFCSIINLPHFDINCKQKLNLADCTSLIELDASNSAFTEVTIAEGAPVTTIKLSQPTTLTLNSLPKLTEFNIENYGKLKTVSQMVFSILIMIMAELFDSGILPQSFPLQIVSNILLGITAVLCVISGAIYIWGGKEYIKNAK